MFWSYSNIKYPKETHFSPRELATEHYWADLKVFCLSLQKSQAGIHIRSRPVILDNYSLTRTIKLTSKDILWMSEVLLNH